MRLSPFAQIDRWLAPPPAPARIAWIGGHGFAHRGLHGPGTPENGASAFAAAIAGGYGIECDVQRTRDGRAVVFHDWELDRLTEESGPVAARDADELVRIALAGSADRILDLPAFLDLIDGRVPLLIEIKSRRDLPVAPLCRAVALDLGAYRGLHGVMSFDPRVSGWFARRSPHTSRGLVVSEAGEQGLGARLRRRLALWHARPDFLAYDVRDLPSRFAEDQRLRGLAVATWTVRSAEDRARARIHADAAIFEHQGPGGLA